MSGLFQFIDLYTCVNIYVCANVLEYISLHDNKRVCIFKLDSQDVDRVLGVLGVTCRNTCSRPSAAVALQ